MVLKSHPVDVEGSISEPDLCNFVADILRVTVCHAIHDIATPGFCLWPCPRLVEIVASIPFSFSGTKHIYT